MTYTEHAGKESLTISKRVIRIRISKKDRKHKWPQYLIRFIVLVVEESGVPGENHRFKFLIGTVEDYARQWTKHEKEDIDSFSE
jgi:hypothetical protein